jgi:single-strand DNA-binding protein
MYQQLTIVGHLGQDPEMRYTPSGQAVTNFSVATGRKWTTNDGQAQEETTWFRVAAWGKLGEVCNEYLAKGRQVMVIGRLTQDKETNGPRVWQASDGSYRASFEVTAHEVKFLGSKGDNGSRREPAGEAIDDDQIPF